MTNWKTYKITCREQPKASEIWFQLDKNVQYKVGNGSKEYTNRILCESNPPFNQWREGDYIEIDNDLTSNNYSFFWFPRSTNIARFVKCHHGCDHSYREHEELKARYNSLENERSNLLTDLDHLKREHGKLERERNALRDDKDNLTIERDEWIRKYNELRKQSSDELNAEKLRNTNAMASEKLRQKDRDLVLSGENTKLKEQLSSADTQVVDLTRRLENKEEELRLVRTEKDTQITQKSDEIRRIEGDLANLRIENEKEITQKSNQLSEKEKELKLKEEEIQRLQSQRELSQEELLIEKLRSEKENLELFATELKIDLERVQSLINDHKQLFQAQKVHNQTNITTYENNITQTKRDLQNSGFGIITIQEVCRKCEKITQLNWELTQIQQQQYQAQQEVPTNNN